MQKKLFRKNLVIGIILIILILSANVATCKYSDNSSDNLEIPRLRIIGIMIGGIKNLTQDDEYYNFDIRHLFLICIFHDGSHWQPFFTYLNSQYIFPDGGKTLHLPKHMFHGSIRYNFIVGLVIEWYNFDLNLGIGIIDIYYQ